MCKNKKKTIKNLQDQYLQTYMNRKKSESRLMVILKVLLIKKQKVSLTLNLNKLSIFATPFKPLSLIKTDVDILFFCHWKLQLSTGME